MRIYRMQIFDYDCQSDPLVEFHCKVSKENKINLEKKIKDFWIKEGCDLDEFIWHHYNKDDPDKYYSIYGDDDCKTSIIEIIKVTDLVYDDQLTMESE